MSRPVWLIKAPADNRDPYLLPSLHAFLDDVAEALGEPLTFTDNADAFGDAPLHLFLIGSGGSEQAFKKIYRDVDGPYYLLTTRSHNSLAASMEILSFLREQGEHGEILHGTPEALAARLRQVIRVAETRARLRGMRLGVTGESSWLIGRPVDRDVLRERTGMELVDVPMEEILSECEVRRYTPNAWTERLLAKGYDREQMERALGVYGACRRIVDRYELDGFTLRCFDLLEPLAISGCLALAILNAEGIWSACEGDSRSLVSMVTIGELTRQPVFMANPSRIYPDRGDIVFAHCVLPLNMSEDYRLTTHFESGLGVSIAADFSPSACTVFKCDETFTEYFAADAELRESLHDGDLCRTQMAIHIPKGTDYFLKRPIANHHMIVLGHHEALADEFFQSYN
ncbi:MAG: hypothetical protein ACOYH4_03970 [Saccharofermentanales bacterium]|jgi:L-fucose isomerase-like protein